MSTDYLTLSIIEVMAILRDLGGIKDAPHYPPEKAGAFPFAIGYPGEGLIKGGPMGATTGVHDIKLEVHMSRENLPRAFEVLTPYIDTLPRQLYTQLYGEGFTNFETFRDIPYVFAPSEWGGVDTVALIFTVAGVKILESI